MIAPETQAMPAPLARLRSALPPTCWATEQREDVDSDSAALIAVEVDHRAAWLLALHQATWYAESYDLPASYGCCSLSAGEGDDGTALAAFHARVRAGDDRLRCFATAAALQRWLDPATT